ncbi:Na+/H+ antiporter NhaC family protein [Pontiella sulfatireligans]|uniref:Malate-2H(+)/Na(+)-lactate antiporter n=1 Tax=Pontiella sulfatireligans TaxID=2750658 RepID=A0A6C2UGH7_9BACT|nr:Na+/H+ antiporter NhaC family protein [Pontiella sulfatireligans]VGO18474.1 Malate-2H(+)/Na(+)-lactate antiporter [Pontiella sulfatireligans]
MKVRPLIVLIVWLCTWLVVLTDASWTALWPSVVALVSVFLLNRSLSGLLIGASAGLILLANGNPFNAFVSGFSDHLIPVLQSAWNLSVLIFTLLLGGFVALLEKGGGIQALMRKWFNNSEGNTKRRVQWGAYSLGLICFFDGLANSMLVGKSLAPMAKKAGVSRQKMAYIVDSTSSAVACVAVISTWIAYQLSMIREGLLQVDAESTVQPFQLFLNSIPFNYYCWFTLILLAVVISKDWNIGPMRRAEADDANRGNKPTPEVESNGSALPALIPLTFLIIGLLIGLYGNGVEGSWFPLSLKKISDAYGNADAALVLVCVSAAAGMLAYLLNVSGIRKLGEHASQVFGDGVLKLFNPVLILISAWVLSSTLRELDAVHVLSGMLNGNLPPSTFPALVFVTGALISFSTGTSWGTMGILMPLALPVALGFTDGAVIPLIHGTVAAVFSGAVFGDHCSPFSDTTIVSSISCGIEPMEHVRTQMPYALIAASLAILIGFLPSGLGLTPYASLALGVIVLFFLPTLLRGKIDS